MRSGLGPEATGSPVRQYHAFPSACSRYTTSSGCAGTVGVQVTFACSAVAAPGASSTLKLSWPAGKSQYPTTAANAQPPVAVWPSSVNGVLVHFTARGAGALPVVVAAWVAEGVAWSAGAAVGAVEQPASRRATSRQGASRVRMRRDLGGGIYLLAAIRLRLAAPWRASPLCLPGESGPSAAGLDEETHP